MPSTTVIGSLRAVLSASIAEFTSDMGKAADEVGSFRKRFAAEGAKAVQAGALMAAGAAAGWYALSVKAINAADDIGDAAQRIGFSAEELQGVQQSAKHAGMAFEDTAGSLQKFTKNAGEAVSGNKEMIGSFKSLGISVADLRSQTPYEIFLKTADAISRVSDPAQRLRLTLSLFGKSGGGWVNVFENGAKGIEDVAAKAQRLGIILSNETIAKAGKAADQLDDMNEVLKVGATVIGLALLPAVSKFAGVVTDPAFIHGVEAFSQNIGTAVGWMAEHKSAVLAVLGAIVAARFGPGAAVGGGILGGLFGGKLFETEIDRVNAKISEVRENIRKVEDGSADTFGQKAETVLAVYKQQLGILEARKAFLEGPPDTPVTPPTIKGPTLSGLDGVEKQANAYDNAVEQIRKRTAVLEAQGKAEDRSTFAMDKATAAAGLRAAADAAGIPPTAKLTKEIDALAEAYAKAGANADVEAVFAKGEDRIAQAKIESQLIGETAVDAEARRFSEEQTNAILAIRPSLTEGERARIEAQTDAYREQLQVQEQQRIAMENQIQVMDTVRYGLENTALAGMHGFADLKDAASGFLQQLADMVMQLYVIRPMLNSLFGASGTGAGGMIGSLFSGMFADGGTIPAGHWGIAGENGPEPIFAGSSALSVIPNDALGNGGGGNVAYIDARGADAATVARIEAAVQRLDGNFEVRSVRAVQSAKSRGGAVGRSL